MPLATWHASAHQPHHVRGPVSPSASTWCASIQPLLTHLTHAPPGLLFFTTYTLLVLFWAEIYHQARSMPTGSLRPIFIAFNGVVYGVQVRGARAQDQRGAGGLGGCRQRGWLGYAWRVDPPKISHLGKPSASKDPTGIIRLH